MRKASKARWLAAMMVPMMLFAMAPAVGRAVDLVDGCGECGPYTTPLIAGQHIEVGTVTVKDDGEQVCVTYELSGEALEDGWLIYETHLYVGADDDFPLTRRNPRLGGPYKANPIPGRFPYGDDGLDGVESWTFCVSLEELGAETGQCLYIAAHAVIERTECEQGSTCEETAWGEGDRFNERGNWGMWFKYKLCEPPPVNGDPVF